MQQNQQQQEYEHQQQQEDQQEDQKQMHAQRLYCCCRAQRAAHKQQQHKQQQICRWFYGQSQHRHEKAGVFLMLMKAHLFMPNLEDNILFHLPKMSWVK
jgi:hypothetical protein